MNKPYSRISENALFAALLVAVIGWTAVAVAADQPAGSTSAACAVAHGTAETRHS
jgi:hypothetical protein